MNKKLIYALTMASSVNADTCAPQGPMGAQNNVMVLELGLGASTMKGNIIGTSETPIEPTISNWDNAYFEQNAFASNDSPLWDQRHNVSFAYQYNGSLDQLKPNAAQMGFAGIAAAHYLMRHGDFGFGLYAGVGLNQSKISAEVPFATDMTDCSYNVTTSVNPGAPDSDLQLTDGRYWPGQNEYATPNVKITSGLNFQVGMRPGIWINNMFFHARVGWQILQLQSKISGVYKPTVVTDGLNQVAKSWSSYDGTATSTVYEYSAPMSDLGNTNSFVKKQWTNALTLGAGLDIAHKKFVYGFYYQVAIFQKTKFTYNKNFTSGLTEDITIANDTQSGENNKLTQTYGGSKATVSIMPVISTFMMSVKYCFNKG